MVWMKPVDGYSQMEPPHLYYTNRIFFSIFISYKSKLVDYFGGITEVKGSIYQTFNIFEFFFYSDQ